MSAACRELEQQSIGDVTQLDLAWTALSITEGIGMHQALLTAEEFIAQRQRKCCQGKQGWITASGLLLLISLCLDRAYERCCLIQNRWRVGVHHERYTFHQGISYHKRQRSHPQHLRGVVKLQ